MNGVLERASTNEISGWIGLICRFDLAEGCFGAMNSANQTTTAN